MLLMIRTDVFAPGIRRWLKLHWYSKPLTPIAMQLNAACPPSVVTFISAGEMATVGKRAAKENVIQVHNITK